MDFDNLLTEAVRRDSVRVPPYPATALRLQAALGRPDYTTTQLVDVMKADPIFTGNLLRLANSSFYRRGDAVTSVALAVQRVGAKELTRLAMAAAVNQIGQTKGPFEQLRRRAWRQALTSGLLAEALAKQEKADAGEGFVAGLLHDVGKLLAIECLAAANVEIHDINPAWDAVERFHLQFGLLLSRKWQLPEPLEHVIGAHHSDVSADDAMTRRVQWADMLVMVMEDQPQVCVDDIRKVIALDPAQAAVLAELMPKIPSLVEAFEAETSAPPPSLKLVHSQPTPPPQPQPQPLPTASETPKLVGVVAEIKGGGVSAAKLPVQSATRDRLFIETEKALQSNLLVETVLRGTVEAKFWAVVITSVAAGPGFVVELKPFALNADAANAWKKLAA